MWSALYAVPAVFITTFDIATSAKVIWLVGLIFPAALITWFLHILPAMQSAHDRFSRHFLRIAALPVAAAASIAVALYAANAVQAHIQEDALLGCVAIGAGNSQYADAFEKAYIAAGGQAKLGCARTNVNYWVGGYQQVLQGPSGQSIITAITPDRAFVLDPDMYQGFLGIAGQGVSFEEAGYPLSNKIRLKRGWKIDLVQGDQYQESALIKEDAGHWYWVPPYFWALYNTKLGGPDGQYGYPTTKQQPLDNGLTQTFEHGWLFYRADTGVLTQKEYQLYKAGRFHPTPTAAGAVPPTAPPNLRVANVYDVNADGGVSYRLAPNDHLDQAFHSDMPFIDQVGVIVGLDPRNQHSSTHTLKIQIVDPGGRVLGGGYAALVNNEDTVISLPDLQTNPKEIYRIRVYNESTDILGIYLNDPGKPGGVFSNDGSASISGVSEPKILCGYVEGRTLRD